MNETVAPRIGLLCALAAAMALNTAQAANLSFTGQLSADDEVPLFSFVIGALSSVTVRTWSYAGGINAEGTPIVEGGFDPMVAVFDHTGLRVGQQDDGGANVSASPLNGLAYDSFLTLSLNPGTYTASLMVYNNSSMGPNLSDGFLRTGSPSFTSAYGCSNGQFCDSWGHNRSNGWALDVLNVDEAAVVPAPPTIWLLGAALGFLRVVRRKAM